MGMEMSTSKYKPPKGEESNNIKNNIIIFKL